MKLKFDFNKIIGYFNLDSEKGLSINSFRDWKVLLVCSLLFLVVVFGVDIYSLLSVRNKMNLAVEGSKNAEELKINEADLNEALKGIDTREENFKRIASFSVTTAPVSTTTSTR